MPSARPAAAERAPIAFWSRSSKASACAVGLDAARRAAVTETESTYHSRSRAGQNVLPVPRRAALASAALPAPVALAVAVAGCGRRATLADCQLIVDRSVELQMREMSETDPKAVAKRTAEVRAELDDQIKSCEGQRRVTEKTMSCVQAANTTTELDKCLR